MNNFQSLKELINTLSWAKELLVEMFGKRKAFAYKYDYALEVLEEARIETLCMKGILRKNGAYLEIDEQFQSFFEQVLEVNEDINTHYVNENIQQVKQYITFYLQENNEQRKHTYLRQIKAVLRKIGRITLRNIIDLNRNIENAFKTEPNYVIKITRLEAFDEKSRAIYGLIEQTGNLITDEETTFFTTALDDELKNIISLLRSQLTESRHNLIETQKQIIEYLNQVKQQSRVLEKIKQIKYLKDQFEIKAKTNIAALLTQKNGVMFEARPGYPLKLSLDYLHTDEGRAIIEKVANRLKHAKRPAAVVAETIASHDLIPGTEEEIFIDLEAVKQGFLASGNHLYNYIMQYKYPRDVSYEEKITIFCQMASLYENEFNINEVFQQDSHIEYALINNK